MYKIFRTTYFRTLITSLVVYQNVKKKLYIKKINCVINVSLEKFQYYLLVLYTSNKLHTFIKTFDIKMCN